MDVKHLAQMTDVVSTVACVDPDTPSQFSVERTEDVGFLPARLQGRTWGSATRLSAAPVEVAFWVGKL